MQLFQGARPFVEHHYGPILTWLSLAALPRVTVWQAAERGDLCFEPTDVGDENLAEQCHGRGQSLAAGSQPARGGLENVEFSKSCEEMIWIENSEVALWSYSVLWTILARDQYLINDMFRVMDIQVPALLMFIRGTGFWLIPLYSCARRLIHQAAHIPPYSCISHGPLTGIYPKEWRTSDLLSTEFPVQTP